MNHVIHFLEDIIMASQEPALQLWRAAIAHELVAGWLYLSASMVCLLLVTCGTVFYTKRMKYLFRVPPSHSDEWDEIMFTTMGYVIFTIITAAAVGYPCLFAGLTRIFATEVHAAQLMRGLL